MTKAEHGDGEAKRKQQQAVAAAARQLTAKPAPPKVAPPKAAAKPGKAPLPPHMAAAAKAPLPPHLAALRGAPLPPHLAAARAMQAARVGTAARPSALKLPTSAPKPEKKEAGGLFGWLRSGVETVRQAGANVVEGAKKNVQGALAVATDPKKRQAFVRGIQDKAKSLISTVTDPKQRAEAIKKLYTKLPGPVKGLIQQGGKVLAAGEKTLQKTVQAVQDGLKVAKKVGGQLIDLTQKGLTRVAGKINEIRNSPGFKKTMAFIKESGIQVAKFGTTLVVGGLVIAGAAVLTAATGGLAGPALVAALFASGSLGGAAGTMVENLLRGKKAGEGITAKSMLLDGALSVAMGPASKIVGGLAKGLAKPVLGLAAKAGKPLAGLIGKGVTKLGLDPLLAAGKSAAGKVGAKGLEKLLKAGTGLKAGAMRFSERLGKSKVGQAADWVAGGLGRGLGKTGETMSKGLRLFGKGAKSVVGKIEKAALGNRVTGPALRKLSALGKGVAGRVTGEFKNASEVVGGGMSRAKLGLERGAVSSEQRLRNFISAKTGRRFGGDQSSFITSRVFNTASRAATNVRAYAGQVGGDIRKEVAEQWASMGGVQNAARTAERVEAASAADEKVAAAIKKHEQSVLHGEINAKAREIAQRDGISMTQARKLAGRQVNREEIREQAVGNLSPKLAQKVSDAYNAKVLPGEMGYKPGSGLATRLPGMLGAGANNMLRDAAGRMTQLGQAYSKGGLAGLGGTVFGNFSEELSKPFMFGAADKLRKGEDGWGRGGLEKMQHDWYKAGFISLTNNSPQLLGNPTGLLTPLERGMRSGAASQGVMSYPNSTYQGDDSDEKFKEINEEYAKEHGGEHPGRAHPTEHVAEGEHP